MNEYIEKNGYEILLRPARKEDLPKIGEMSYAYVFPPEDIWEDESAEKETARWSGRYETFPKGLYIAEDIKLNKIVGATATQIINWNYNTRLTTWSDLTDDGTIRKTHNPNGNTLHIVSVHVHRDYAKGLGIGSKLLSYQKELFGSIDNLEYMIVGHTLGKRDKQEFESFKKFIECAEGGIENKLKQYIDAKTSGGEILDALIRFYNRAAGMLPSKILIGFEGYPEYDYCVLDVLKKGR